MANDGVVELLVWAQGQVITALEIEPFRGARLPARMPILETIRPYPPEELRDGGLVQTSLWLSTSEVMDLL